MSYQHLEVGSGLGVEWHPANQRLTLDVSPPVVPLSILLLSQGLVAF